MTIDYHHKYIKYKAKYLQAKQQSGGGSWNYFSFDNDQHMMP